MRRTSKAVFLPASDEPYVFVEALPDATSARALRRILPLMNLYRASAFQARVPIRRLTIAESETASGLGIVVLVAQFRRAFRADAVQGPYAVPGSLLFGAHVPRIAVPFTRPGMASRAGALRNRSDDPAEVGDRLAQALFEAHARGSQPSSALALAISGLRFFGSSSGRTWKTISDRLPVMRRM